MDFKNGAELLELCREHRCSISEIMRQRECDLGETTPDTLQTKMERILEIMRESASGKSICGNVISRAITYACAVLEVNTSMGLIVAAPTAGSSGIVPGVILALKDEYRISDDRLMDALFNAGAIGYLAMRNATVAGAVGGCQAEVGVAAAMAASAATELMGGEPEQCLSAASSVLMNMLGLVCDPIGGLVECPCQGRNAAGAAIAIAAAEMALSGIRQIIPFDEMLAAMYSVGKKMPSELRETALGGCAATPTGCAFACGGCGQ